MNLNKVKRPAVELIYKPKIVHDKLIPFQVRYMDNFKIMIFENKDLMNCKELKMQSKSKNRRKHKFRNSIYIYMRTSEYTMIDNQ